MHKRVPHQPSLLNSLSQFLVLAAVVIFASTAEATDQGKLGKSSSASVDISVTVNQTFNSVSPNELLLNKSLKKNAAEPFCVAHHGYNQNANVPYELVVDDLKNANGQQSKHAMPFNVYLENKNIHNSKQQLTQGVSISTQSNLRINKNLQSACANSGLQLSIEENKNVQNAFDRNSVGIMVLLVSPT